MGICGDKDKDKGRLAAPQKGAATIGSGGLGTTQARGEPQGERQGREEEAPPALGCRGLRTSQLGTLGQGSCSCVHRCGSGVKKAAQLGTQCTWGWVWKCTWGESRVHVGGWTEHGDTRGVHERGMWGGAVTPEGGAWRCTWGRIMGDCRLCGQLSMWGGMK